ncbi:hypothetical protein ACOMHN_033742 [Nucella lapillus]
MDSGEFAQGFQYNLLTFGDLEMSMADSPQVAPPHLPAMLAPDMQLLPVTTTTTTPAQMMSAPGLALSTPNPVVPSANSIMPPPSTRTYWAPSVGEEEASFNDSGYFSSPQAAAQFTGLHFRQPAPCSEGQAGTSYGQATVHAKHGVGQPAVPRHASPRSSWQEDFPNISDSDWDSSFLNNFEEHLFSIDPSEMNTLVDGILGSPFKSPNGSPFKSPRQSRGPSQGLSLSPLNSFSPPNVMLSDLKKSPAHLGGSPFKGLFFTPSPHKGCGGSTKTSPMTRQRRRILQSPPQNRDRLSDHFPNAPSPFPNIHAEAERSDVLGIAPFQRTNSMGFTPTDRISPPFSFKESSDQSGSVISQENFLPPDQLMTPTPSFSDMNAGARPRQHKKIKMDSLYNLRSSPAKAMQSHRPESLPNRKSPARHTQGRISVTRHSHLVDKLDSKGALRFVRARFQEVLAKAAADADRVMEAKLKACGQTWPQQLLPEAPQAFVQPEASNARESSTSVRCYTQIQPHRPPTRRRQEILPKPTPDWPQRQPCKIAPKKRKR